MADEMPEAVSKFIRDAERVYDEYDEGYIDPDAALSVLGDHITRLRDSYDE
ncbi:MAG: hypothetical protein ACQETI_06270 [Halobacteriota archaeon]